MNNETTATHERQDNPASLFVFSFSTKKQRI